MSFDEQLRRAFDTLSDHLRDELARQFASLTDQMTAAAAAERDQALAAVHDERNAALAAADHDRAEALAAAGREHELALEAARNEAAAAAREQGRQDAERDLSARLANATTVAEALGRQKATADAQARIASLETELQGVQQRAAVVQEESRQALERAAAAARVEARAGDAVGLERLLDAVRAIDRARSLSEILDTLVGCAAREAARAGVLLVRGGQLRAWRFIGFEGQIDRDVDVPAAEAGILADAVRAQQMRIAGGSASAAAPRFAALPAGRFAVAVPIAIAGQVVAVLYADQPEGSTGGRPSEGIELLARHAASALEALTAFKAARHLVSHPDSTSSAGREPADEHESARRFARLLVSEIKLYHEADVLAGRRERNLVGRLAGEIERARTLYDERVPAAIRAGTDYFHAELVRTLASGDPSLLGDGKA